MKYRLDRASIAIRAAKELQDGQYVNLGYGIGGLAPLYASDESKNVVYHGENGILGFGRVLTEDDLDEADIELINGASQFVAPKPGMSFFDMATAFSMMRGGHLDVTVLGAFQVSERGDIANAMTPNFSLPVVGGAMDLAHGTKRVIVAMFHTSKNGDLKIVKRCTYPLTARKVVQLIITDVAVIEVTPRGLLLKEYCPGWTVEEIQAITEPRLRVSDDLKEISL